MLYTYRSTSLSTNYHKNTYTFMLYNILEEVFLILLIVKFDVL